MAASEVDTIAMCRVQVDVQEDPLNPGSFFHQLTMVTNNGGFASAYADAGALHVVMAEGGVDQYECAIDVSIESPPSGPPPVHLAAFGAPKPPEVMIAKRTKKAALGPVGRPAIGFGVVHFSDTDKATLVDPLFDTTPGIIDRSSRFNTVWVVWNVYKTPNFLPHPSVGDPF